MAVIMGSAAQQSARNLLLDVLRQEIRQGNVSSTSEMIGYFMDGLRVAESYNKAEASVPTRRVVAPEFLQGLISDESA